MEIFFIFITVDMISDEYFTTTTTTTSPLYIDNTCYVALNVSTNSMIHSIMLIRLVDIHAQQLGRY